MKTILKYVVGAAVLGCVAARTPFQLPGYLQPCRLSDTACLKTTMQEIIPRFSKGAPEFGLPPLDPMRIRELQVDYEMGENIKGRIVVSDSDTYGLSKLRIADVRTSRNESHVSIEVDVKFPEVYIEGRYKSDGMMILIPVRGRGYFNNSMSDLAATWKMSGSFVQVDGDEFLRLDHFRMRPEVEDMKVFASGLFMGSPELNEAALVFANRYWRLIYEILLPFVEDGWDRIMTDTANKVFLRAPYDVLFSAEP
ncbi:circadian clock-controlled protein daywake-like [Bacillus rossius redtenbacheri]|uniref:circadian clock-controlled protein daywake-like n=1 Tax=Bacillus rossius redtenbacheri TaxID=93214 RepID=UPI002FDCCA6C